MDNLPTIIWFFWISFRAVCLAVAKRAALRQRYWVKRRPGQRPRRRPGQRRDQDGKFRGHREGRVVFARARPRHRLLEPAGQRRAAEDELFDPHEVVSYLLEPVWKARGESRSL